MEVRTWFDFYICVCVSVALTSCQKHHKIRRILSNTSTPRNIDCDSRSTSWACYPVFKERTMPRRLKADALGLARCPPSCWALRLSHLCGASALSPPWEGELLHSTL